MGEILKGAGIGLICTIIFYFIPAVNSVAPFLGGLLGGYVADGGVEGGLKSGILMALLMVVPGFLLAGIMGTALGEIPFQGVLLVASTMMITLVIVAHTAVLGIIGSIIGALLVEKRMI